jgi:deoxyribonuclease IV
MRDIGLHLRITTTLDDLIAKAVALQLDCFQCFFVQQATMKPLRLSYAERKRIECSIKQYNGTPIVHGSYWINLAGPPRDHTVLQNELTMAEEMGFNAIVIHPGSAKHCTTQGQRIESLAQALEPFLQLDTPLTFMLENVAHGGVVVGGDLNDFKLLREVLGDNRLRFCIDTAHAHGYGYDIISPNGRDQFVALLDETVGIDNIILLHINDTTQLKGSRVDTHTQPGMGEIGNEALREFVLHQKLKDIPLLLELPPLSDEDQESILEAVREWHIQ